MISKNPGIKLLLVCYYKPSGISTVKETVEHLRNFSRHEVEELNMYEFAENGTFKVPYCNLGRYDGVIVHNSFAYNVRNLVQFDRSLREGFRRFRGVKVIMKQDENFLYKETAKFIGERGFDLVLTCLGPEMIDKVYPAALCGRPRFERMLTGYVTPEIRELASRNPDRRPVDIGYRGSIQPIGFGRLSYEKRSIGNDVLKRLAGRKDLRLDISSRWEDRFEGKTWYDFLLGCKAILGVESGASVFDFDGEVEAIVAKMTSCGVSDEEILKALEPFESNFYNQISPRHFEATAAGALQLLYPGRYSGIFVAGRHYFELKRDLSNIDDAIELVKDERARKKIVECAMEEIIFNEKWHMETFVSRLDDLIEERLDAKHIAYRPDVCTSAASRTVFYLANHEIHLDPRFEWMKCAPFSDMRIVPVGLTRSRQRADIQAQLAEGQIELSGDVKARDSFDWISELASSLPDDRRADAAIAALRELARIWSLGDYALCRELRIPYKVEHIADFKHIVGHFLSVAKMHLDLLLNASGESAIIAADLVTLAPALIAGASKGIPVVYDAHEFWAENVGDTFEAVKLFWQRMERKLCRVADMNVTVSSTLADYMSGLYGCRFGTLVNCEVFRDGMRAVERRQTGRCKFIFQGNFAPDRGLEDLIEAWCHVPPSATLHLRGPDNVFKWKMKALADKLGLTGKSVFFEEPVSESELVSGLMDFDVGIIPYPAIGANYSNCCPNKMSQYMAASLPILANETAFVKQVIKDAGIGVCINFKSREWLLRGIVDLAENGPRRAELGRKSFELFRDSFCWQKRAQWFYEELDGLCSRRGDVLLYPWRPRGGFYVNMWILPWRKMSGLLGKFARRGKKAIGSLLSAKAKRLIRNTLKSIGYYG